MSWGVFAGACGLVGGGDGSAGVQGDPHNTGWAAGCQDCKAQHVDTSGCLLPNVTLCLWFVQVHVAWLDGGTAVLAFMGTQSEQYG